MIRVKICGITNREDASEAVSLGVDALGFIFARSPRQISPERARHIITILPATVRTVGVFVNEEMAAVRDILSYCRLDFIQLHGEEPPEFCRAFMPQTIKAIQVKDESSLSSLGAYEGSVKALLLDTYRDGRAGGTGESFDWRMALKAKRLGIPIILSGGLNLSNITRAMSFVKPCAVDINSGIEERPGKKSPILMKELMEAVQTERMRDV
jgi:phosphoribosylanthranilate isomerase